MTEIPNEYIFPFVSLLIIILVGGFFLIWLSGKCSYYRWIRSCESCRFRNYEVCDKISEQILTHDSTLGDFLIPKHFHCSKYRRRNKKRLAVRIIEIDDKGKEKLA